MRRLARYHPFLLLIALGAITMLLSRLLHLNYDDGRVGLAWFVFSYVVLLPMQIVGALLGSVLEDERILSIVTPVVTIVVLCIADYYLGRWSKRPITG